MRWLWRPLGQGAPAAAPNPGITTVAFRVAVLTVDTRMVYLLANPSSSFDFSDDDWRQLAVRAGQRVSQSS